jgi:hypothetical protein
MPHTSPLQKPKLARIDEYHALVPPQTSPFVISYAEKKFERFGSDADNKDNYN